MDDYAKEAIRRGTCPACNKEHRRRLVSCKGCGETLCANCAADWIVGGLCAQCHAAKSEYQLDHTSTTKDTQ